MRFENKDFQILTDYILSINVLDDLDLDVIEDWAIQLINFGYENEAVFMLATFYKPINLCEIMPFLKDVFLELDLKEKNREEGEISFIKYHLNKVIKTENVKKNLRYAMRFYIDDDTKTDADLCLNDLSEMWDEMKHAGSEYYYKSVGITNIERVVIIKAKLWLENN